MGVVVMERILCEIGNNTLTEVNLRKRIGADGARALAGALELNTSVTTLDLWDNNIGADGARALAGALERNTSVTTLHLLMNDIGADGARALAGVLERNT